MARPSRNNRNTVVVMRPRLRTIAYDSGGMSSSTRATTATVTSTVLRK
jgi:hypothetical protein